MQCDSIEFHNVGELRSREEGSGHLLQRVPEAVRRELNDGAQTRMRHPAGVELRFVPEGSVEVTLSSEVRESPIEVFWGPFQETEQRIVGAEPTTIELSFPEKLGRLKPDVVEALPFDPRVCRIRLPGEHRSGHVTYHGADGDRRPPRETELPDRTYLAYGTSITEGEAASVEHLAYVSQTARRLDADLYNLGSCGTAYCDPAMADHIAERDDWDVATLALTVNMVGEFPVETFRERAAAMIDTVAGANPDKPVVAITLYPHYRDICEGDEPELAAAFREALREIVSETPHENVRLIEGADVLTDPAGLAPDLIHPGDDAMVRMGENLAVRLEPLFDGSGA